jgi:hypothetical protein
MVEPGSTIGHSPKPSMRLLAGTLRDLSAEASFRAERLEELLKGYDDRHVAVLASQVER